MSMTPEERRWLEDVLRSEVSKMWPELAGKIKHGLAELMQEVRSLGNTSAVNFAALSTLLVEKKIVSRKDLDAEVERQKPIFADALKFRQILRESGIDETGSPSPDK